MRTCGGAGGGGGGGGGSGGGGGELALQDGGAKAGVVFVDLGAELGANVAGHGTGGALGEEGGGGAAGRDLVAEEALEVGVAEGVAGAADGEDERVDDAASLDGTGVVAAEVGWRARLSFFLSFFLS